MKCVVCADMALYLCRPCAIRFCSKHKSIHEKRNLKSHNTIKSMLDHPAEALNKSVIKSRTKAALNTNLYIPDYTSSQEITGILEWYNKTGSDPKTLTDIKAKYLEYKLSQENQILLKGHTSSITSVLITSDNKYIISASYGRSIKIWNFQSRIQEGKLKGHTDQICSMAITSDNQFLVSGSADKTIRIWNINKNTGSYISRSY